MVKIIKEIRNPIIRPFINDKYERLELERIPFTCIWMDIPPKLIKNNIKYALSILFFKRLVDMIPLVKSKSPFKRIKE